MLLKKTRENMAATAMAHLKTYFFRSAALGSIATLSMTACSPMNATAVKAQAVNSGNTALAEVNYACLDGLADYQIDTSIIDFELHNGGGVTAGFSPASGPLSSIGVNVAYASGQLITEMKLSQPLKPGVNIVDTQGTATQTKISFGADFAVSLVNIGANYYSTTPLSTLSTNAITNNWTSVGTALAGLSAQPDWWTHITQMNGAYAFFIPRGTNAGIQVGDSFKVMNASYYWTGGAPCTGEFEMAVMNSTTPLAVGTVQTVSSDTAYIVVDPSTITGSLATYNYVTINNLVQPPAAVVTPCTNFLGIGCPSAPPATAARTSLARSLKVGTLTSRPLTFEDGTTSDITSFVQEELHTLLSGSAGAGYYLVN